MANEQNSASQADKSATEIEVKIETPTADTTKTQPSTQPVSEQQPNVAAKVGEALNQAATHTAKGVGEAISNTAAQTGKGLVATVTGIGKVIGTVAETTAGVTEVAGNTASQLGKSALETATGVGGAIANTAAVTSKAAAHASETAAKQIQQLLEQATANAGQAANLVSNNPLLKYITKVFRADWLLGIVGQVDVVKAEAAVKKLQKEHPHETPNQIAHRIMVEKSLYAGGIGLVSNLVPSVAAAMLAVDLAATTLLQAEMVYQIAAAYGLDLKDPARKGEVLAIFGLSLGGSRAIKAGLGLLEVIPMAGAAIGSSANAAMLYSLGYAACRFYEAKTSSEKVSEAKAEVIERESEEYLNLAIAQQSLSDQILAHMMVATYPEKTWSDIILELQQLQLAPTSMHAIAKHIENPQPLETLLNQLNGDFALPVLAQCYRIAQRNQVISPEEQKILDAIAQKFNIDQKTIEDAVKAEAST